MFCRVYTRTVLFQSCTSLSSYNEIAVCFDGWFSFQINALKYVTVIFRCGKNRKINDGARVQSDTTKVNRRRYCALLRTHSAAKVSGSEGIMKIQVYQNVKYGEILIFQQIARKTFVPKLKPQEL